MLEVDPFWLVKAVDALIIVGWLIWLRDEDA